MNEMAELMEDVRRIRRDQRRELSQIRKALKVPMPEQLPDTLPRRCTMNEMIERVAQALQENRDPSSSWYHLAHVHREDYRSRARAALAPLREPTEAMLEAGRKANALVPGNALGLAYVPPDMAWKAMIEEALK